MLSGIERKLDKRCGRSFVDFPLTAGVPTNLHNLEGLGSVAKF